ncbi:MAG: amino acid adenylation domain-containing protein [Actinomycetota bacterium]
MSEITTLNQLVDQHRTASRGDELAVTDGQSRLTWNEYGDLIGRIATVLRELGVAPGDRVGVHLPKSVTSFAAAHGVLRAGAVIVPLDALAPPAATNAVVTDAGASALVTAAPARNISTIVDGSAIRAIVTPLTDTDPFDGVVTRGRRAIDAAQPADRVPVEPDDLAYLMYTSGSTGRPKGMAHTHRSGLAYARLAVAEYAVEPTDRLANIAPLHFDQSTFELYAAPLAGAAALIVPDGVLRFPASLAKLLAQERVTIWYSVPYVLDQMVMRGAIDQQDLTALRWILYGGEAFSPTALARAMRAFPDARVSNVYGPAEVNQCTVFNLDAPPTGDESIPIGGAWSGAQLRLIANDGTPVASGEPGEVWIASETMMRGYWNRPDLDERSIVMDETGTRWYRTGDLARSNANGDLVFLGRADNQVKVRGHRIEIEAVEAALLELPGVEAGAVVVNRPVDGDDHLIAVVTPAGAVEVEGSTALTRKLAASLPPYAVPAQIIGVDTLQRTGTGKVDRNAVAAALGLETSGSGGPGAAAD